MARREINGVLQEAVGQATRDTVLQQASWVCCQWQAGRSASSVAPRLFCSLCFFKSDELNVGAFNLVKKKPECVSFKLIDRYDIFL